MKTFRKNALAGTWATAVGLANTLLLALVISASLVIPSIAATAAGDQAKVIEAIHTMYVAAAHDDLAKFHTVAAPDFYAFDTGKRFTGDALMARIKDLHAAGKVFVWEVTAPTVQIDGDMALITYINKGSIQDQSGTRNVSWLESAVLRKDHGNWRIHFFHSTLVPSG
jgi:ketosteroid isomerase-like protein